MWFECISIFVSSITAIPFHKAYIVLSSFIDNVISKGYVLMVGVGIKSCNSNISQVPNVIENTIDWCVHIRSHLFDHILTLGKHLRCDFSISVEYMP